ncbi:sigma-70 family RNA polymerase sigma factor [Nitriliruptoraceae bacterium ZYF776]|nr:sigma-70 family RNA polymerase sigma factor [Profundirhabdus halotolerans]
MNDDGRGTVADRSDEAVLAIYVETSRSRRERERAFAELVDRFQRRVFAVCRRTLRDDADAEEATQEVFVRLARSAEGFRGDAKLSTWLYTVARNVATDRVRFEARRPSTPVADVTELGRAEPVAEDTLAARETAMALGDALEQLDATSRHLLLLVAVDGLSYAEAAAATDLAVGTVKSRVSRARVRLGALLADPDEVSPDDPDTDEQVDGAARPRPNGARGPPTAAP